jgi:hypothetical protein
MMQYQARREVCKAVRLRHNTRSGFGRDGLDIASSKKFPHRKRVELMRMVLVIRLSDKHFRVVALLRKVKKDRGKPRNP